MLGRDILRGDYRREAGVRNDDIELLPCTCDDLVDTIEVFKAYDIAWDGSYIFADLGHSLVELRLTTARNEYVGSLTYKTLCGGEPDAAAAARDDGYFSIEC